MFKQRGLMKVYNGSKYKTVSYKNENGLVTFATSTKSHKYQEFKNTGRIKIKLENKIFDFPVDIVENVEDVQNFIMILKKQKVIPKFKSAKNMIVVQFVVN